MMKSYLDFSNEVAMLFKHGVGKTVLRRKMLLD